MAEAYVQGTIVGSFFAATVIIGGVVWLVLYFAFVRRTAPGRGGRHLIIVMASAAFGALPGAGLSFAGLSSGMEQRDELDVIAQDYSEALQQTEQRMSGALSDALSGGTDIRSAADIEPARERLSRGRAVLLENHALQEAERERALQRMTDAGLQENDRAMQDARAAFERVEALNTRGLEINLRVFDARDRQLALLGNAPGQWRIATDGTFEFENDALLDAYNIEANAINAAYSELEAWRRDLADHQAEHESGS